MMKLINIIVTITIALLMSFSNSYAQSLSEQTDVTKILIEKAGQLEKLIKAANAQDTKKLSLIAVGSNDKVHLNEKDLQYLSTMKQLEELYIKIGIDYSKYIKKNEFISNNHFPKLKTFGVKLVKAIGHLDYSSEYPGGFSIFDLRVDNFEVDGIDHYAFKFPEKIKFDNLYIASAPTRRRGFSENKSYGDLDKGIENWLTHSDLFSSGKRLSSFETLRSIHVKELEWLDVLDLKCNPAIIYIGDKKYLANYRNCRNAEDKDITKYNGILPYALTNAYIKYVKLPASMKIVPEDFFYYVTADRVDLGNVTTILKDAFKNSNIKEVIMPASVQKISGEALKKENVGKIIMLGEYAPAISGWCGFKDVQFVIPSGTKKNYELGDWKEVATLEDGAKTDYTFTIDMPGIISAYLTNDIIGSVVSLKLRGLIDTDDIDFLKKCLNLKKLDLSEAFIVDSQNKDNRKQSDIDELYSDFMREVREDNIVPSHSCKSPDIISLQLEELVLPQALEKVLWSAQPHTLKKIVLPPNMKEIQITGTNINQLVLPPSTQKIESLRLDFGEGPHTIDMSACDNPIIKIDETHWDLKKPLVMKMPKRNNIASSITINNEGQTTVYFQDKEIPKEWYLNIHRGPVTVYIPKEYRAGYGSLNSSYKICVQ